MPEPPRPPQPPAVPPPKVVRFGAYEIHQRLGGGAMGQVFKARQAGLDRWVALKIVHSDLVKDPVAVERFMREARAVGKLSHPNIVAGIDVGSHDGIYFLSMEYVEGETIEARIERLRWLEEPEALEWCRQIASALDHAHRHRYLHRDVKPANIIITKEGVAKLTDLGLVRAIGPSTERALTKGGITIGTPHYMSPEQAQGVQDLGPGSDLYALGVLFFECLTGRVPFDSDQWMEVLMRHISEKPPNPRTVNPAVSEASARICLKLLEKDPAERFQSGAEVVAEFEKLLRPPSPAPPPPPARQTGRSRTRRFE